MAPTVQNTAMIFEDVEPTKTSRSHKRMLSVGDVLRGRRKENSPTKPVQLTRESQASPSPLGERHINSPPQPKKVPLKGEDTQRPPFHKKTGSTTSLKDFIMGKEKNQDVLTDSKDENKPKKKKSTTNLVGLLKKRSKKDLKDSNSTSSDTSPPLSNGFTPTPIWSQFATQPLQGADGMIHHPRAESRTLAEEIELYTPKDYSEYRPAEQRNFHQGYSTPSMDFRPPQRPFLEHKTSRSSIFTENLEDENDAVQLQPQTSREDYTSRPSSSHQSPVKSPKKEQSPTSPTRPELPAKRSSRILDTIATLNMRSRRDQLVASTTDNAEREVLSSQDIDSAMENMLGRFDVPQALRDNLRQLKPSVKAGLMKGERIGSGSSADTESRNKEEDRPSSKEGDGDDSKRSRSRSKTRSRILSLSKRSETSPTKDERSGRARSKSRPKSIDTSRPLSARGMVSTLSLTSVSSPDCAVTPGDFIHYLREVQKPALVEVGKLHKLRILLRNESVSWTDAFVKKGGMDEIVQLLFRIMSIEWREEHEDSLLHETLLCLKGLSTTSLAMQRLELMSKDLVPALLKMLFDPERKGPAEFSTRGVIISLIFSQLSNTLHNSSEIHTDKAREILRFMRDPDEEAEKQPLDFVTQMHVSRPWRVWCKEVTNVTKEVFWIFLHQYNVIPVTDAVNLGELDFARGYFPAARAPHPAAPYVGGVEWEATQYLATHLDLLNGLIVSLPTPAERNELREQMRRSGWEKTMGGTLRTCKEKFYGGVHDGLRAWVAAAKADGWPVEDVRAGPPREASSPRKSPVKKSAEAVPQLALNVSPPASSKVDDGWL